MVLTKDRAYLACQKILAQVKKIKGADADKYLENNFEKLWVQKDSKDVNFIEKDDVQELFEDFLAAGN